MLNHNNNSLLKASSRAKEILTLLNSCSQIATVYSRDFSLRMSVLDEEEDALDSLGDQMSRNMRDIKTNFASSKCGYTCLLSIGRYFYDIAGLIKARSSLFGPNLDPDGLLRHYIPMLGVANYNFLALTVLNPRLVRNLNARDELK